MGLSTTFKEKSDFKFLKSHENEFNLYDYGNSMKIKTMVCWNLYSFALLFGLDLKIESVGPVHKTVWMIQILIQNIDPGLTNSS